MAKCIAFERQDGGVSISHLVEKNRGKVRVPGVRGHTVRPESDEEFILRIVSNMVAAKVVNPGDKVLVVESDTLPSRETRDKWRIRENRVVVEQ